MKPLSIPDGDALWAQVKRFWTRETKIALFAALACALLTHLYILTNDLPNHDAIYSRFSRDDYTAQGKWFFFLVSKLDGRFSAPWMSGLLSLLLLSASSVLTVRMLDVRRPVWIILLTCLMVTCPTISSTLAYWAYPFMGALLFAVIGAYWTDRRRFGWIGGGVLLGLSLGTYQAYLFTALSLFGIRYLQQLLSPEPDDREMGKKLLRYALALVLAAAVYIVGLKVMQAYRGVGLSDYKNISSILGGEGLSVSAVLTLLGRIYRYMLDPGLWRASGLFPSAFSQIVYGLSLLINLGLTVYLALSGGKKSAFRYGMLALVTVASPLLFNGIFIVEPKDVYACMTFSRVLVFAETAVLFSLAFARVKAGGNRTLRQGALALGYVLTAAFALLSMNWFSYGNHAYAAMDLQFDSHYAIANRVVDRIEQTEGFTYDMPVYFTGYLSRGVYGRTVKDNAFFNSANAVAFGYGEDYAYFLNDAYIKKFMANYVGVYFADADSEAVAAAMETETFQNMPSFPEKGSVAVIDGILLVKLNET